MAGDRTAMLLGLCCALAGGCEPPAGRQLPGQELPLATSRSIDQLQPSADRERLFFLTDINPKKESATLDVVTADGAFRPLAALVYQPSPGGEDAEAAPSPWWDEQPLHRRSAAPAFQLSPDGAHALAWLQRHDGRSAVLAVLDAASGAMATVATKVEREGYQLDASGRGAYFLAGSDTLYHVASPGQERVEIAAAVTPASVSRALGGRLLAFHQGCSSRDPPKCRLSMAAADGSAAQLLSERAGARLRDVVFDARGERVLFPEDAQDVSGLWGLASAALVSAPVDPASKAPAVRLAPRVQAGAYRFSPDGRWVALLAQPWEDGAGPVVGALQLVRATGGEPRTIAAEAGAETHFSADGKRLYFLREPSAALEVSETAPADPDEGEPTQLADRVAGLRESPGGSKLLFLADSRVGVGTLQLLSLASGKAVTLGRDVILGSYRFAPDGRFVYWAALPSGASRTGGRDSALLGALPYRPSDGAQLFGAAAPDWAPVLLTTGIFEQRYYPSPDGSAVLSFPRVGDGGEAAAVLSFLDGTRATLANGLPPLWSMPDEPAFSPSGKRVAFFASARGEGHPGQGAGKLEVATVPGGQIVGELDDVRTFTWLAGDRLYAVVHGREESLVAVPLSP